MGEQGTQCTTDNSYSYSSWHGKAAKGFQVGRAECSCMIIRPLHTFGKDFQCRHNILRYTGRAQSILYWAGLAGTAWVAHAIHIGNLGVVHTGFHGHQQNPSERFICWFFCFFFPCGTVAPACNSCHSHKSNESLVSMHENMHPFADTLTKEHADCHFHAAVGAHGIPHMLSLLCNPRVCRTFTAGQPRLLPPRFLL